MENESLFSKLADKLVHPSVLENEDVASRARMVAGLLFINTSGLLLASIILFIFQDTHVFFAIALKVTLAMSAGFIVSSLLIWKAGRYIEGTSVALLVLLLTIFGAICISGGPAKTPFNILLLFIPVATFLFLGKAAGVIVVFLVFSIEAGLLAAHLNGFEFASTPLPLESGLTSAIFWVVAYCIVCEVVFIYEATTVKLQSELKEERDKFEHMACHDALTGLDNRVLFYEKLGEAISRGNRHDKIFALLYLDLDGFKPVNDTYGHDAGDLILTEVAKRLINNLRKIDTVARLGGDEFALLLEGINEIDEIKILTEKITTLVAGPVDYSGQELIVRASIGISVFPDSSKDPEELTKIADDAMYKAKAAKPKSAEEQEGHFGQAYLASTEELLKFSV